MEYHVENILLVIYQIDTIDTAILFVYLLRNVVNFMCKPVVQPN